MRIYFSCSITGGRDDEPVYRRLVAHLQATGHEVLTAHLASPEVLIDEATVPPEAVYERDCAWVRACDAMVAEVSTPSHGVGYEIAYALTLGKPVLCCYQAGRKVSKMITGNSHPCLSLSAYATVEEAVAGVGAFLARAG